MRRAIVSNHFRDPVTGGRVVVAPIVRTSADGTHQSTILRGQGRSFMTVADLRRGYAINSARPGMNQARNTPEYPGGGAGRPAVQGQGRMSRPVFVMQNQSPMPESSSMKQNQSSIPQSPSRMLNQARTSRSSFLMQNAGRISGPSFMVQNQGRLSGSTALRGTGMSESGRFNAPHARDTGGRGVVHGGVRRGGW
jgi:hypothetical protein